MSLQAARAATSPLMPLCQVALSTLDLSRTHHWYRRALGLAPAGRRRHLQEEGEAPVPDLPELSLDVWCLVDQQDWFQFELIEFQRPRMRRLPDDWRPCDIGYSTIGLQVNDFDAALDRIARTSGRLLTPPLGAAGERRVCMRDPDGNLLELMEDAVVPPRALSRRHARAPLSARFVTVSVPNLERARRFWEGGLGLPPALDVVLHRPEHEALWGLAGASRRTLVLSAGDLFVELVEYVSPVGRARPSGYLLCDQGVLNVAFGSTDRPAFEALVHRLVATGYRPNCDPWRMPGVATVVYFTDDYGLSVEVLHVEPAARLMMGFAAPPE